MADNPKANEQTLMWELVAALENMRDCFVKLSLDINDRKFDEFISVQHLSALKTSPKLKSIAR